LVPGAREALDELRNAAMTRHVVSMPIPVPPADSTQPNAIGPNQQQSGGGDLTARQAGKLGGDMGGPMVQKLIAIAEQERITKRQ